MKLFCPALLALVFAAACGTADRVSGPAGSADCPEVVEDGGGGVPGPPDGALECPEGPCNYQLNSGCDATEACLPSVDPETPEVAPACQSAGEGRAGDECTAWADPSDCAPGYFCADGACRKLCCGGDWSACDEGSSCFRPLFIRLGPVDDQQDVPAGVGLCFPTGTCDVLEPESCADEDGRTCKIVDPTGKVACVRSGSGKVGESCESAEYCGPGLSCVANECRRLCRAEACGEPACPQSEGICTHFDRNPPGVGECS